METDGYGNSKRIGLQSFLLTAGKYSDPDEYNLPKAQYPAKYGTKGSRAKTQSKQPRHRLRTADAMIVKTRPELVLQQEDQQRGPALLALTV